MPYIIRHQNGALMGFCTNKPGPGNLLPDGSPEIHDFYEDDPKAPSFDAAKVAEADQFRAAQEAKIEAMKAPKTTAQKLVALGITPEELKAELAK